MTLGIPPPVDGDDDDVAWALQTAQVQWQRGAHADAIVWLRRAVDAAIQAGASDRATQLNGAASQLTEAMLATGPPMQVPPAPPRTNSSLDVDALLSGGAPSSRASIDIEFEDEGPTGVISDENPFLDAGALDASQNPFSEPPPQMPWATEPAPPPGPSFPPVPAPPPPREPADSLTQVMPLDDEGAATTEYVDNTVVTSAMPVDASELVAEDEEATNIQSQSAMLDAMEENAPTEAVIVDPPLPPFDHVDTMTDIGALAPASVSEPAARIEPPPRQPPPPRLPAPAPAPEPEPEPAPAPEPAGEAEDGVRLEGVALGEVEGLEDLPPEAQAEFAARARLVNLDLDEEVGQFAVALVLSGWVSIMPAIADAACAHATSGDIVFTAGSMEDGIALRVVAGESDTRVAVWDLEALNAATADCPWVADELRIVADRYQALAGATMGPLGDRLDDALREQVTTRCSVRMLLPGEEFVKIGAPVPGMHIIGAGRVEVLGEDGAVLEELGPGDFLFAAEVMSAGSAHGTARAGEAGALVLFAERMAAHELLVSVPPLLEILAS